MSDRKRDILRKLAEVVQKTPEDQLTYLAGFTEGLAASVGVRIGSSGGGQ